MCKRCERLTDKQARIVMAVRLDLLRHEWGGTDTWRNTHRWLIDAREVTGFVERLTTKNVLRRRCRNGRWVIEVTPCAGS
jgi:hypothetical protein